MPKVSILNSGREKENPLPELIDWVHSMMVEGGIALYVSLRSVYGLRAGVKWDGSNTVPLPQQHAWQHHPIISPLKVKLGSLMLY